MTNQFSNTVSEILAFSKQEANRTACPSVTPEHLLLAMLREQTDALQQFFKAFAVDTKVMKMELEERLKTTTQGEPVKIFDLALDEKASNILKLSVLEARLQHSEQVTETHLLLAMLHDKAHTGARDVLEINNLSYEASRTWFTDGTTQPASDGLDLPDDEDDDDIFADPEKDSRPQQQGSSAQATQQRRATKTPVLDNFSFDMTRAAAEGKLDPVVGREKETQRVLEILGRRKKNNPVLIGEPGVGKSAIVEGLAQLIAHRQCSPMLYQKRVLSLDLTSIVAGTKYRGQFEERIKALIRELEQNPDIIVFIDEIHTLVGAGSTPGSMDAANILKPSLARGTIQCIGATTLDEYRKTIEKDGALERRFQKVTVNPTTPEETLTILHNIKPQYEKHHHVSYTDEALEACVSLTQRYVSDRQFPDKAIDALDETGSHLHLGNGGVPPEVQQLQAGIDEAEAKKRKAVANQNFELAASYRDRKLDLEQQLEKITRGLQQGDDTERPEVTAADVAEVVSRLTGVPVQRMQQAEGEKLRHMADELKAKVIAQDKAVDKVVRAIQRNRVGLKDPNRPIGAFMFLGPTGVGKTYLAKQLARMMFGGDDALIRIDMSEYAEAFNTSRLVGAPPGYVGYDEGGQLTERVRRKPYSIVLLDEIEKAHGNVFNMLLQVLDEGRLTDGNGRLVDFRNTIIIMTSNAGTRQLKEFGRGIGFGASAMNAATLGDKDKEHARSIIQKSLSKQFSPEFLNRLVEIITFDQLDLNAIKRIVDLELKPLTERVEQLGYHLQLSPEAKEQIAVKGYDVQFGARPLKRALQTYVEDTVCERILSGDTKPGDTIAISSIDADGTVK